MEKKLQRIPHEGAVAGVCAGLGEYFKLDKTWVRVFFILSVFFAGYGIGLLGPIVYVVLWIVLPVKPVFLPKDPFDVDYRTSEFQPPESSAPYEAVKTNWGKRESKDRYIAGTVILAIGLFFLLHQLNVFYWHDFARFWPVLIIILGVAMLIGAFDNNDKHCQTLPKQKEVRSDRHTAPPISGDGRKPGDEDENTKPNSHE